MIERFFLSSAILLCLGGCLSSWYSVSETTPTYYPTPTRHTTVVPEGTALDVKLNSTLDSGTRDVRATREGALFTATVIGGGTTRIPRGTTAKGRVDEIKHMINRTSMRLVFYELVLPGGQRVAITATPSRGSQIKIDELQEGAVGAAQNFLIEKGIDAITAGVLAPLWVAKKVVKGYDFVTKEERMILPQGSTITIKLRTPAYIRRQ